MSVHEALRTLVTRYGERVLDGADDLHALLDDFLEEGEATPGDIALLVDAVRLGAYQQMLTMLSHGADPKAAIEAAGARMAKDRGGDPRSASWACAALGYAVRQVPEPVVLIYRSQQPPRGAIAGGGQPQPPPPPPHGRSAPTQYAGPPALPPTQRVSTPPLPPGQSRGPAWAIAALVVLIAVVAGGTWFGTRDTSTDDPGGTPDVSSRDDTSVETAPTEAPQPSTPTTEPTPEPSESPSTNDDPLAVAVPFVNQSCEGQVIVVLASSGEPSEYVSTIAPATGTVPGAKYLRTDQSCDAFVQDIGGQPIYAAYIGPFASIDEACEERYGSGIVGAYVRTLETGRTTPDICSCRDSLSELPRLSIRNASDGSYDVKQRVVDLQTLLRNAEYNPEGYLTGYFKTKTRAMVRNFQRDYGLVVDGWVGPDTWDLLRRVGCF